jgi:hypothetical protein
MRRALIVILVLIAAAVLGGWLGLPRLGRWYVQSRVLPRIAARFDCEVSASATKVGFGWVKLSDVVVRSPRDGSHPLFAAASVEADFRLRALVASRLEVGEVVVRRPAISVQRNQDGTDNVRPLLARLRGKRAAAPKAARESAHRRLSVDRVRLEQGTVLVDDRKLGVRARVGKLRGMMRPGRPSQLLLEQVTLDSPLVPSTISLARVELSGPLRRGRKFPTVRVEGGHVQLLPRLQLSGITGKLAPMGESRVRIDMEGSYGGAEARLWHAGGVVDPFARQGEVEIRAARFELGRIASILRETPVISPADTTIDGQLRFRYRAGELSFDGGMEVAGLNLFHPSLARTPVEDLSGAVALAGTYAGRVLEISHFDIRSRGVQARLAATLDRSGAEPLVTGQLIVPPLDCQKVLDAFPPALMPDLQGFALRGTFAVDLKLRIDFAHLDEIALGGRVGINRCRVARTPPAMAAERLRGSFEHVVEAFPGKELTFTIGPENPDFTPYDLISPNVIGAVLTTEDAAFFRHRGFIPLQFRKALGRNLKRGSFSPRCLDDHDADGQERAPQPREDTLAQAAGALLGLVCRAQAEQRAPDGDLPQCDRVRPGHLWHRSGESALFRQAPNRAHAARVSLHRNDSAQSHETVCALLPRGIGSEMGQARSKGVAQDARAGPYLRRRLGHRRRGRNPV